jgi:hypothetical protein
MTDPADITSRIEALLDVMKMNMSIHTIHLDPRYGQHDIFRESVIPYFETNRFRLRVRAIQKTRPSAYRDKVLGRALLAASTDVNRFWMLLSGNAEVVLSSKTATTTPAANLPTPLLLALLLLSLQLLPHITAAITRDGSTTGASAAGNVATTPTAYQNRKAHP